MLNRPFFRLSLCLAAAFCFLSTSTYCAGAAPARLSGSKSAAIKTAREGTARTMRRLGILGSATPLTRSIVRRPAVPDKPAQVVNAPRGLPLSIKFFNFSSEQASDFQSFLNVVYPTNVTENLLVRLYGEPAAAQRGKTLRVESNVNAGDGVYNPPPANSATEAGTILYDPVLPGNGITVELARQINNYNLVRQILIAFHGRAIFSYDAWELGFADAAALVAMYQSMGSPANFEASRFGVYLLTVYDFFNRPDLGNAYFFTGNDTSVSSQGLGFYRIAMAQAAWLKVWVENPAFFRSFNEEYYRRLAASTTPLSAQALKQIAVGIVPTVEDLGFADWYRRQYVLDTSVTVGEKLWIAVLPFTTAPADQGASVALTIAQYYKTLANGDEQFLSGSGRLLAFDEKGIDITDRTPDLVNDQVSFDEGELEKAVGFTALDTPNQARISLVLRVNAVESVGFFPYNVAGTDAAPSGYFGAVVGANTGQVTIQVTGSALTLPSLLRGAFKSSQIYPSRASVKTDFTVTPNAADGGAVRTVRRNSAWSFFNGKAQSFGVILETPPANTAVPVNLASTAGNRLRMVSLPLFPMQSDEAAVFGLDPARLLMARYRPNLSPASFSASGVTYGIGDDRHELYPNISQPIAPGRGFWLKLPTNLSTTVRGGEPPRTTPYEVPLLGGWNQIGNPFRSPLAVNRLKVSLNNATPVVFSIAVGRGYVAPGIWRWKAEGGYERVDTGAAANQVLQPFEGYYIFTTQPRGVKLAFDPTQLSTTTAARSVAEPLTVDKIAGEWDVSLSATSGASRDTNNAFGVTTIVGGKPRRVAAAKPPAGERALTLSFLSGGTTPADDTKAGKASGWAESFAPVSAAGATWQFLVDGATPGQTVRLNWGSLAVLPANLNLTLLDEGSGQRVSMAASNPAWGYAYTAGATARRFRIEATSVKPLIQSVRVEPYLYSSFAMVSAEFGGAGTVSVEILHSNGTQLRLLAGGEPVRAGRSSWLWNGRDAYGRPLQRGTYIARVMAVDAQGVRHQQDRSFQF